MVVHLNFITFSSLFFAIKLVLFPAISIIACGKVPSILDEHYAKGCENKYGEVIKSLITFLLLSLSLCMAGMRRDGGAGPVRVWGGRPTGGSSCSGGVEIHPSQTSLSSGAVILPVRPPAAGSSCAFIVSVKEPSSVQCFILIY